MGREFTYLNTNLTFFLFFFLIRKPMTYRTDPVTRALAVFLLTDCKYTPYLDTHSRNFVGNCPKDLSNRL